MNPKFKTSQAGSVLVEAMMAILIFSFGVLAIAGLQAATIMNAADAKYRNEASFFANRLIGEMWAADRSSANFSTNFATSGANYAAWYNDMKNTNVATGLMGLPGADVNPSTVTVTAVNNAVTLQPASYDVVVTVRWQLPGKPVHKHDVVASITTD